MGAPTQPRENAPALKEPGAATFLMTPLAGAAATAGIPLMGSRVALGSMIGGPPRR